MADNLKELEKLLVQMSKNPSQELAAKMMEKLEVSSVFVSAIMPKDTPPEILKSMMKNTGKHAPIPDGANPQPGILQNDKNEHFIAVYTTEKELGKARNKNVFPLILNIPFKDCLNMATQNRDELDGIVINPFSHNVILRLDRGAEAEEEVLEGPQLDAAIRRRLETEDLPKSLFDGGETAVESLKDNGADYILDLYNELYGENGECPYDETDFDFMTLSISETLLLTRVAMPAQNNYPGTCRAAFAAWNPVDKKLSYFTIERKTQIGEWIIVRVTQDGTLSVVGDAPDEGVELQSIIDLVQEQEDKQQG